MRSTLQAFSHDLFQVIGLIEAAKEELASGRDRESPALDRLARRLRNHLRLEEELIFPAVERQVQDPEFRLTATLRREHQAIRALLAEVERDLAHDNRAGAVGTLRELLAALHTHEQKERQALFPIAGRVLEESDPALVALLGEVAGP